MLGPAELILEPADGEGVGLFLDLNVDAAATFELGGNRCDAVAHAQAHDEVTWLGVVTDDSANSWSALSIVSRLGKARLVLPIVQWIDSRTGAWSMHRARHIAAMEIVDEDTTAQLAFEALEEWFAE
eukprot:6949293-Prymnesium_polylepis.1